MSKKERFDKNLVPEGFTIGMALVDFLPVIFFGLTAVLVGILAKQPLIYIGAAVCFVSGLLKVLWKFIVVIKKKNVWPLFMQMRICMPLGFLLVTIGLIISIASGAAATLAPVFKLPSLIFMLIGFVGMGLMIFFAVKLDPADPTSNWIEQLTNSVAQCCFFIAFLILMLGAENGLPSEQPGPLEPSATPTEDIVVTGSPEDTIEAGFKVSGTELLDAKGNPFIMRGINMAHKWFALQDKTSLEAIAATGANCVRIVCANGEQWTKDTAKGLTALIDTCKSLKMIAILEIHDATGKNDLKALEKAVDYWLEVKDVFPGTEAYCIINIANEWPGNWDDKTWKTGYVEAVSRLRQAGIKNTLMIDTGGYGQNGRCIEKAGKVVFAADPLQNTMFSVHMYGTAGKNENTIKSNLEYATKQGLCVCVGEFGYTHSDGDVDEAFLMSYCVENKIGYLGWSWKGNGGGVEYLDIAQNWDGSKLSEDWGEVLINGKNGIRETSKPCSVFEP